MYNLDPEPFNAADIGQIVILLKTDPHSEVLDRLFGHKHYPVKILSQLRREDFRSCSEKTISDFINKFVRMYYNKIVKGPIFISFREMLINGDVIPLAVQCYLINSPMLVRAFERSMDLPETGDYYKCIAGYRQTRYTINVAAYHEDIRDHLYPAVNHGHRQLMLDILNRYPDRQVNMRSLIFRAIQKHQLEIAETLMAEHGYDPAEILIEAVAAGELELAQRMLPSVPADTRPFDAAGHASRSGNLEMIKWVIAHVPGGDNLTGYVASIANLKQIHVLKYFLATREVETRRRCDRILEVCADHRTTNIYKIYWSIKYDRDIDTVKTLNIVEEYATEFSIYYLRYLLEGAMSKYKYDLFDAILPYYVKKFGQTNTHHPMSFVTSNSRYFFDRLSSLRQTHDYTIHLQLVDACKKNIQPYIFHALYGQYSHLFVEKHLENIICHSITYDRIDAFNLLFDRCGGEVTRRIICAKAFQYGRYQYFERIFVGELRTQFGATRIMDNAMNTFNSTSRVSKKIISDLLRISDHQEYHGKIFGTLLYVIQYINNQRCVSKCLGALADFDIGLLVNFLASILIMDDGAIHTDTIKLIFDNQLVTADNLESVIRYYIHDDSRVAKANFAIRIYRILNEMTDLKCVSELLPRIISIDYERSPEGDIVKIKHLETLPKCDSSQIPELSPPETRARIENSIRIK